VLKCKLATQDAAGSGTDGGGGGAGPAAGGAEPQDHDAGGEQPSGADLQALQVLVTCVSGRLM